MTPEPLSSLPKDHERRRRKKDAKQLAELAISQSSNIPRKPLPPSPQERRPEGQWRS